MPKQDEGQDFASAAMMRLVALGLARQGIAAPMSPPKGAHVPRPQKSDVLAGVLAVHGPKAILSIADAARSMAPEPVVQALTQAKDMGDLWDRWHRLERFSHGRHTVVTERLDDTNFRLSHRARQAGPAPSVADSLLVLGLLTILAEMTGSIDITLTTAETGAVWRSHGVWRDPVVPERIGSVILTAGSATRPAPAERGDIETDPIAGLRKSLARDPLRRWTVAELAAATGTSPRTLQRRLTEHSTSFSRLVTEARVQVAATHLCQKKGPALAEIGFLAGFADQAHFARSFSRAVGTTPSSYRADFGR
jgi:AraC-like DNA-binding protein